MQNGDSDAFLPPDPDALVAVPVENEDGPAQTPASAAVAAHTDALMKLAGVIMVGETLDVVGRPAVLIGVKTARALAKLPTEIDGVPVVTQVIGEVDAQ